VSGTWPVLNDSSTTLTIPLYTGWPVGQTEMQVLLLLTNFCLPAMIWLLNARRCKFSTAWQIYIRIATYILCMAKLKKDLRLPRKLHFVFTMVCLTQVYMQIHIWPKLNNTGYPSTVRFSSLKKARSKPRPKTITSNHRLKSYKRDSWKKRSLCFRQRGSQNLVWLAVRNSRRISMERLI